MRKMNDHFIYKKKFPVNEDEKKKKKLFTGWNDKIVALEKTT